MKLRKEKVYGGILLLLAFAVHKLSGDMCFLFTFFGVIYFFAPTSKEKSLIYRIAKFITEIYS